VRRARSRARFAAHAFCSAFARATAVPCRYVPPPPPPPPPQAANAPPPAKMRATVMPTVEAYARVSAKNSMVCTTAVGMSAPRPSRRMRRKSAVHITADGVAFACGVRPFAYAPCPVPSQSREMLDTAGCYNEMHAPEANGRLAAGWKGG